MAGFRDEFKELLENTYISAKGSEAAINTAMSSFLNKILPNIPDKLFRYRKIDEGGHILDSFKQGTISVCKAKCFSDKYDSMMYVDVNKELDKMRDSSKLALQRVINDIKNQNPQIQADKASRVCYYLEQGMSEQQIIEILLDEIISKSLNGFIQGLKQREARFRDSERTARIGWFTESVQSKFMWDTYAGGYRGFALEYNLREFFIRCLENYIPAYVFPVIYTNERPDLTLDESNSYVYSKLKDEGKVYLLEPLRPFLDMNLLSAHKPFLYKDKEEYGHEREWRLLYYDKASTADFMELPDQGCLKAIYYGPDIKQEDYEKLHSIASRKRINEYRVSIDDNSRKYSLKVSPLK